MHPDTRIYFEQQLKDPIEMPSLEEFFKCLENRFQALEAIPKNNSQHHNTARKNQPFKQYQHILHNIVNKIIRDRCNECGL